MKRLVVVTLNTHSFQEGRSSLEKLSQIGRGLAALAAYLVGLNEVMSGTFVSHDHGGARHDGAATIRHALERASQAPWYGVSHGFAHWASGELMSNVILSRTPILESDCRPLTTTAFWPAPSERREVIHGRTHVPGAGPVNVFVAHPWGWDCADAEIQIAEVKAFMADKHRGDESLELLLGDLNMPSTFAHYSTWLHAPPFDLIDTYAMANPGHPHTPTGDTLRIDYILAREGWKAAHTPPRYTSHIVFDGPPHDRLTLPVVSDHRGVLSTFDLRDPDAIPLHDAS